MKKIIVHLVCLFAIVTCFSATTFAAPLNQTINVRFDESMFKIDCSNNVINRIQYVKGTASMPTDTCLPALPSIPVIVSGPAGSNCDFTYRVVEKHLIFEDVNLPLTPSIVSSKEIKKLSAPASLRLYKGSTYPTEAVQYRTRSPWANATDFHFACTPFVYDAASRSLYLIDEIELTVNYSDAPAAKLSAATTHALTPRPSFLPSTNGLLPIDTTKLRPITPPGIDIEPKRVYYTYEIITSEALKPAFERLAQWKNYKGIYTRVQTKEYIDNNFSGKDIQEKIKNYLHSFSVPIFSTETNYEEYSPIKFVLLGGGSYTIPPRYCAGDSSYSIDSRIPTDLYFACLNDQNDWDRNGNGIYGEAEDEISMAPSFAVTRVPLDDLTSVNNYIDRLIAYEMTPKWTGKMLFAGVEMNPGEDISTNQKALDLAATIKPYWSGSQKFLFDTKNSFGYNSDVDHAPVFSPDRLDLRFQEGYNFVEIVTHGEPNYWNTQQINTYDPKGYTAVDASAQHNSAHTIIVTANACYSSAFDRPKKDTTSLCEAFFLGKSSGVVGYLGASRSGYFSNTNLLYDPSFLYEQEFYDRLFESNDDKNFGSLVAQIKYNKIGEAQDWSPYRWLQYSINPLGDPEMPIFTESPLFFDNIDIEITGKTINVNANEPGSKIAVSRIGNAERSIIKTAYNDITVTNLPDKFLICITKQNFKPWIYVYQRYADGSTEGIEVESVQQLFSENIGLRDRSTGEIIKLVDGDENGTCKIITSVNAKNKAYVIISNLSGDYYYLHHISNGYHTNILDITNIGFKEYYTASLYVDGVLVDSKKTIRRR